MGSASVPEVGGNNLFWDWDRDPSLLNRNQKRSSAAVLPEVGTPNVTY